MGTNLIICEDVVQYGPPTTDLAPFSVVFFDFDHQRADRLSLVSKTPHLVSTNGGRHPVCRTKLPI